MADGEGVPVDGGGGGRPTTSDNTLNPRSEDYADAEFIAPQRGVWPAELLEREQWMGHVEKRPFAPWADRDHPDADADEDARWKWGLTENYVDGETVAIAEDDPRLDGRVFIQQADDPYAYVDGDDVRCPETGEVHPTFLSLLEQLGATYTDVSTSESGVHANYRGALPDGLTQATFAIDAEPWGANEDVPEVEIYAGKRVCVMTGKHVPGTPTDVREWDDEALYEILDEYDRLPTPRGEPDVEREYERFDAREYEPTVTAATETTDDIRDLFAALERLDARWVAEDTIVHAWNDEASTSDGKRAFKPTWGRSANGTANIVDENIWQDTGGGGYGGPVVMALIDRGDLSPATATPRDARGALWFRGVDHLRDLGYAIPEYDSGDGEDLPAWVDEWADAQPLVDVEDVREQGFEGLEQHSALPLRQLDALDPAEARRFARKRGIEWPTTTEARRRLRDRIMRALRAGEDVVLDAPTALGKSFTVATEPWLNHADITDEQPVVQFSETRAARDGAAEDSEAAGVSYAVLKGRTERCPVAKGVYDPGEDTDVTLTIDGVPASIWFDEVCDRRGMPFSVAHAYFAEHNDQGAPLPCCADGHDCPAVTQWEGVPRTEDGAPAVDVVHATHQFARVPSLVAGCNDVFDELPNFAADLSQERVRRAVTAFLKATDAEVRTFEHLVEIGKHGLSPNEHDPRESLADRWQALRDALDTEPPAEWYLENADAHTLAPALARAILNAEEQANDRRTATVPHRPPRFDDEAQDDDGWNRVWVTVVLDEDNTIRTVRAAPDLSAARSVIGLDAHPTMPLWQRNTNPGITRDALLDPEERRLWRRYERGLVVVQVGDATRPLTKGEYFDEGGTTAMLEHLRAEYGDRFRTAITAKSVANRTHRLMRDVGIDEPAVMHYGEEKSRNDFAGEAVGFLNGCIDPGDEAILDQLAECGLDARPKTTVDDDGEEHRAHGREFVGPDAATAQALLASVRENHVAQGAGRYARDADDPENHAVVFVRTDALLPGFADLQVAGVEWTATDTQREIIEALRDRTHATARELADAVGVSKDHVRKTLRRLVEADRVECREGAGDYGAHVYRALAGEAPTTGLVSLGRGETIADESVWESYTWSLAITPPPTPADPDGRGVTATWDWRDTAERGTPPPERGG
ncbi:winged helix-turn-helix transcriptional regulator [Halomarina halobia]|uniref:Winged helix-turn-helix transcriptional regulator n=1 Tax=Halomarina halobia TaxID=3033386 RepID=A0ABD6ACF3_9EURY|nr:winged helix-turn-helix transcriptional regulator [Halomarina sp. PSR21]